MLYTRELDCITGDFILVDSKSRDKFTVNEEELIDMLQRGISVVGVALLADNSIQRHIFNDEISKLVSLKIGDAIALKMPEYDLWLTVIFKGLKNGRFVFQLGTGVYKLSVLDITTGGYMFSFSDVSRRVEASLSIKSCFPSSLED